MHKITKPTDWTGGMHVLEESQEDATPMKRCEEKRNEWAKQCDTEVQEHERP